MNQPSIPEPEQQESEPKEVNPVEERLVSQWKLLMPAVTWVMAMIGSFWLPAPPGLITEDTKVMVSFAKYLATISTGIMVLPILKWSSRKHAWLWGKIAATAAVSGASAGGVEGAVFPAAGSTGTASGAGAAGSGAAASTAAAAGGAAAGAGSAAALAGAGRPASFHV